MSAEARVLLGWWALGAAAVALGGRLAPGPLVGLGLGLMVGSAYVWLLARRTRTSARLSVRRAVLAAQLGAAARLGFVLLAFALAFRWQPDAGRAWAIGGFFLPVAIWMVGLGRGAGG